MTHRSAALIAIFVFLGVSGVARAQSGIDATDDSTTSSVVSSSDQTGAMAQTTEGGFFHHWFAMVSESQAEQPHWITPLATTTPRLEQEFRFDVQWQPHNNGVVTGNVGVNKGLEIIPAKNVEIILSIPAYVLNNPASPDGFGDWQFLVKYRLAAQNEEHGNYILTAFFQMSVPTGQFKQGVRSPVITPTIAYGKAFRNFDAQGTLGISLPTDHETTIGRNLLWNNAFQYKLFKKLWPETEVNFTHFYEGPRNGNTSVYLTPGLVLGKFQLWDRLGFTIGGGYQIAVTSFHPTNHIAIFSMRFPF